MINNDVLRRVRYILDFNDSTMITIFASADLKVSREELSQWLKREDNPDYKSIDNLQLTAFLDGLINTKRGKRENQPIRAQKPLTNNVIFKKLSIAFSLKNEEIIEILSLSSLRVSKHELSAFFRRVDHKNYRECHDQILRKFLMGLQIKLRGN